MSEDYFDNRPVNTEHPMFESIWQAIKGWDIERKHGTGYAGATGTDVQIIIDSIEAAALLTGTGDARAPVAYVKVIKGMAAFRWADTHPLDRVKDGDYPLYASSPASEPVAWRWMESKMGGFWRYDEVPNPNRTCEPLYTSHPATQGAVKAADDASTECPICGDDEPHRHDTQQIVAWAVMQAGRFGVAPEDFIPEITEGMIDRAYGRYMLAPMPINRGNDYVLGVKRFVADILNAALVKR